MIDNSHQTYANEAKDHGYSVDPASLKSAFRKGILSETLT
jgi:hypothetical protein